MRNMCEQNRIFRKILATTLLSKAGKLWELLWKKLLQNKFAIATFGTTMGKGASFIPPSGHTVSNIEPLLCGVLVSPPAWSRCQSCWWASQSFPRRYRCCSGQTRSWREVGSRARCRWRRSRRRTRRASPKRRFCPWPQARKCTWDWFKQKC